MEAEEWRAFHGYAKRNERIIHDAATMAWCHIGSRAGDFEVIKIDELGKGGDEGRNISGSVEQRRVLANEKVSHFSCPILGRPRSSGDVGLRLELRFVDELPLCSRLRIHNRRQGCVRIMGHVERQCLHVTAYPRESFDPSWLGKG